MDVADPAQGAGRERRVGEGGQSHRHGGDREARQVRQPQRRHEWAGGVAGGGQQDGARGQQAAAPDVDADQRGDAGEADEQADQPAPVHPVGDAQHPAEQRLDQRDRGDEEPGERAGDVPLGDGQQPEGGAHLEQREEQQPGPGRQQRAQLPARRRQRQEQESREERPGEHHRRR
jgi:hypothetical protein